MNTVFRVTKLILYIFLLLPATGERSFAQPVLNWDRTLGGGSWDELNGLLALPDGIIAAGSSRSGTSDLSWNFMVAKLNFDGNMVWQRNYGGDQDDRLWAIIPTSDGGFLVGGHSFSGASGNKSQPSRGDMDVWILKLDPQGQLLWEKAYGGLYRDELFDMLELPGGGYLLGCNSWSDAGPDKTEPSRGGQDFWLIRTDNQGNKVWDKTIGGSGYDQINDLEWASDGTVYLSGGTVSDGGTGDLGPEPTRGGMDFWLAKFNLATQQLVWDHRFGGTGEDYAYSLHVSPASGKVYLGGRSGSGLAPPTVFNNGKDAAFYGGASDYWLLELNADGLKQREWSFGGTGLDDLYAVQENIQGHLILGGVSDSGISGSKSTASHGGYDYWLVGLDPNGSVLWERTIGGAADDALTRIALSANGSFVVGGHSQSNIGFEKTENNLGVNDFWVLHFECGLATDIVQIGTPSACSDDPILLDAEILGCQSCQYVWDTGDTQNRIEIANGVSDTFTVAAYDEYGCVAFDTAYVVVGPLPEINLGAQDTALVQGATLLLGTYNPDFQYLWNTGETEATIRVSESGVYSLTVTDPVGCTATAQIRVDITLKGNVWVPNAFSPNFDGYNDFLGIFADESVRRVVTFQIADRWGTLVFRRDDTLSMSETDGWDGEYKEQPAPLGVYTWFAEIEYRDGSRELLEGSVTIVR